MLNMNNTVCPDLNKKYPDSYNIGKRDEKRKIRINCTAINHYPKVTMKILYSKSSS